MRIKIKVKAGARKEEVKVVAEDRLEISVKEKPQNNAANRRVLALVARRFKVAAKQVRIVRGHTSPSKTIDIM